MELYNKAEDHFARAYRSLLRDYGPYDVPALETRVFLAESLMQQNNQDEAHKILRDLQEFLASGKVVNIGISFELERLIGKDCFMDGLYPEAQLHFEKAFKICREFAGNKRHPKMGEIFLYLASCYFAKACLGEIPGGVSAAEEGENQIAKYTEKLSKMAKEQEIDSPLKSPMKSPMKSPVSPMKNNLNRSPKSNTKSPPHNAHRSREQ